MYMGKLFTFEHLVARTKMEIICISQDCYNNFRSAQVSHSLSAHKNT